MDPAAELIRILRYNLMLSKRAAAWLDEWNVKHAAEDLSSAIIHNQKLVRHLEQHLGVPCDTIGCVKSAYRPLKIRHCLQHYSQARKKHQRSRSVLTMR